MSGFSNLGFSPSRDASSSRRPVRTPLPLQERTASENNRAAGIRVVPYSPPRIQQDTQHGHDDSHGGKRSSSILAQRRGRRQRPRRRQQHSRKLLEDGLGDGDGNGSDASNDSDPCSGRGRGGSGSSSDASRPASLVSHGSRSNWGASTARATTGGLLVSASYVPDFIPVLAPATEPAFVLDSPNGSSNRGSDTVVRRRLGGGGREGKATSLEGCAGRQALAGENTKGSASLAAKTVTGGNENRYAGSRWPGSAFAEQGGGTRSLVRGARHRVSDTGDRVSSVTSGYGQSPDDAPGHSEITAIPGPLAYPPQRSDHQLDEPWPRLLGADGYSRADDRRTPYRPSYEDGPSHRLSASTSASPTAPSFLSSSLNPRTTVATSLTTLSRSPSLASLTSVASSQTAAAPRPNSRRHHVITVHADKTFSLVPRAGADTTNTWPASPNTTTSITSAFTESDDRPRSSEPVRKSKQSRATPIDFATLPPLSEAVDTKLPALGLTAQPFSETTSREKPSLASLRSAAALSALSALSFSASTVSAATNYKVYSHSPSSSPPPAPALPYHDWSDDSSLSAIPSSSDSTNIEILGVSSPAAPPLPLRPHQHQTAVSLVSYPSPSSFDSALSSGSSSAPNVVVLGASPTVDFTSSPSLLAQSRKATVNSSRTADSEPNYVLHGEPSSTNISQLSLSSQSTATASLVAVARQLRQAYSQESLVVSPLQPLCRQPSSIDNFRTRSIESLRHAASLRSLRHTASLKSLSSVFGQEAASTFFAGQAFLNLNIPPVPVVTHKNYLKQTQQTLPTKRKPLPLSAPPIHEESAFVLNDAHQTPLKNKSGTLLSDLWGLSSSSESSTLSPPPIPSAHMVEEHPHQWSSQLSTVMSESEAESTYPRAVPLSVSAAPDFIRNSRDNVSPMSAASIASGGQQSSLHSRNLPSISSSLGFHLDNERSCLSRSDSLLLECAMPPYYRNTNSASPTTPNSVVPPPLPIRTVRDYDEHGDGLADLQDVGRQPYRSGLSGFFPTNTSARTIHSSASTRSLGASSFPMWARVYYGSGEHRVLASTPSISEISLVDDAERPRSRAYFTTRLASRARSSPSLESPPLHIPNPHRRSHQVYASTVPPFSDTVSVYSAGGVFPVPNYRYVRPPIGLRKMTSSVWSPHLRIDQRAVRFSLWGSPSVTWSTETKLAFDRRNIQLICFTVGFIFPFAWMFAAFFPLPLDPQEAREECTAESESFGVPDAHTRRVAQANELRFQSAHWWRTLNRIMAIFGLLILGVVVALVVVGIQQRWGR